MKVLVVDDEADIRKIAKLSLEAIGKFETVVAGTAAEGIELARSWSPDLIIMDVMMPGMDGVAAFAELQKQPTLRAIPLMFMTAKVQPSEIAQYLELGAVGVIKKPFDPMTLSDEVLRTLASRR